MSSKKHEQDTLQRIDQSRMFNLEMLNELWTGIHGEFEAYKSLLAGEMLTIIDASISDSTQRESIKSLVKKSIYGEHSDNRIETLAEWMDWFANNYRIEENHQEGSSVPRRYKEPAPNLKNFIKNRE